jgi:hypothetical protein
MIVSIHQPAYLPWLGYLDRIARSDVFIFLDTVQFEKNSFTNRNRIKTANGPLWLTVPVLSQGHIGKTLRDLEIDNRQDWRSKHLRSIEQNYRRAPFFADRFARLKTLYSQVQNSLTELCFEQLKFWTVEFGLSARLLRASELAVQGTKSDLVLALAAAAGATDYISGPQGRGYLDEPSFRDAGIKLHYHDFSPRPYPQLYGEFVPAMAALDYWFNIADPMNFRRMEKPESVAP